MTSISINPSFLHITNQLETLHQELLSNPLVSRADLRRSITPQRGVYVFYENAQPLYVGRTNRMHDRLLEHGRTCSGHNDASFAWKLTHFEFNATGNPIIGTRRQLSSHEIFMNSFLEMKRRVCEMQVRYVRIDDANTQCVFEIYATLALNAPHNDFENH